MNLQSTVSTGDVIEFDLDNERVSALVLLASADQIIIDLCDDEHVFVSRVDELVNLKVFAASIALAA